MEKKRLVPGTVVLFKVAGILSEFGVVLDALVLKGEIPTDLVVGPDQVLVRACGNIIVNLKSGGTRATHFTVLGSADDFEVIWQPVDGFQKLLDLVNSLGLWTKGRTAAGLVSMDSDYLQAVVGRCLSLLAFLLSKRDPWVVQLQLSPEGYDKEIFRLFERGIPFPKKS